VEMEMKWEKWQIECTTTLKIFMERFKREEK
jgi:hypothetical protein